MKLEIDLPDRVPVMTLPEVALFPKVMMPLYIFEPRYKNMLQTSLEGDRMFAVAGIDKSQVALGWVKEPAHEIATLGIIRGCRTQQDGTSHLILQGLSRIHLDTVYEEKAYREAAITPLHSIQNVERTILQDKQHLLLSLLMNHSHTNPQMPPDLLRFMQELDEPEDFADLVAYSFVEDASLKQAVLNSLAVEDRFDLLIEAFSPKEHDGDYPSH